MKKKSKILIGAVIVCIALVYAGLIIKVNINPNTLVYKDHGINEKFEYKGAEASVRGARIYTMDEFKTSFDMQDYVSGYDLEDDQMRVCVIEMELRMKVNNNSNSDAGSVEVNNTGVTTVAGVTLVTDSWANQSDCMLFEELNDKFNDEGVNSENEADTLLIPILLTQPGVRKSVMDNIHNENIWIILPDYEGHEYYDRIKIGGSDVDDKYKCVSEVKPTSTPKPTDKPKPTIAPKPNTPKPTQTPPPTQEDLLNIDRELCSEAGMAVGEAITCNDDVKKYIKDNNITSIKFATLSDLTGDPLREAIAKIMEENQQKLIDMGLEVLEFRAPQSDIGKSNEGVYCFEWKKVDGKLMVKYGTNTLGDKNCDIFWQLNQ